MEAALEDLKLLTDTGNVEIKLSRTKSWGGSDKQSHYSPEGIPNFDYQRDLGNPGEYPYTRSSYPRMYRSKMWTQRAMFGYGSPEDTREGVAKFIGAIRTNCAPWE